MMMNVIASRLHTARRKFLVVAIFSVVFACADLSYAAEIKLRGDCHPSGALVRLGDVADIHSNDEKQGQSLAAVELFPAPVVGQSRFVRVREIQDALILRGVNLAQHQFTGASQVEVSTPGESAKTRLKPVSTTMSKQAELAVAAAITRYLRLRTGTQETWDIKVSLSDDQSRLVVGIDRKLTVTGGQNPWVGVQQFTVQVDASSGAAKFDISAEVSLPPAVAVTTHPLARGAIVRAADVELRRDVELPEDGNMFHRLEDVIGQEVSQTIGGGVVLGRDVVRSQILVRRGDAVTVYARSAGLQVRTTGRATEEGGLGDLIAVETLMKNRQSFFARVSGPQEVEIFAHAVQAASTPVAPPQVKPARAKDAAPKEAGRQVLRSNTGESR
jgi:flagella basal body P-ring formation protein FlgA